MTMEERIVAAAKAGYGDHFQRYQGLMRRALLAAYPELASDPPTHKLAPLSSEEIVRQDRDAWPDRQVSQPEGTRSEP